VTDPSSRLAALRAELSRRAVHGVLVPRSDEFLGEYVPAAGERLAWLTGFTGSAGLALVLPERAYLLVDGRYTTQAAAEADPALWTLQHIIDQPVTELLRTAATGLRIGFDPWLHTEAALARLSGHGAELVPLTRNPIDAVWTDRPEPPSAAAEVQPARFAGEAAAAKREAAARRLREAGETAAVLADPHSVAWLLNIRGADLAHTPLVLARAILRADAGVDLFLDPARAGAAVREHLGNAVALRPPAEFGAALESLRGGRVRLDPDVTPAWIARRLRDAGVDQTSDEDPCRMPRACKNNVEQENARAVHRRDAVAMIRFLAWFSGAAPFGAETEVSAAARLLDLRREGAEFVAESFPAISGAGEHGAIVHYRATAATDRRIRPDEVYLIDSGGQYRDGTTDITRTLWTGPGTPDDELRERYTRVLQGHIALSVTRFPEGVAGPHLDAVARRPLWAVGLDYDHGTGHGVGSFLSVHEGPAGISRSAKPVPLRPGMILSNEPGFYEPGRYGIRIENLLLVKPAALAVAPRKPFLEFETLTLVPYDRRLIVAELLSPAERGWVDAYHRRVLDAVGPLLPTATHRWCAEACAPLASTVQRSETQP
jgi:Xaa-Pro aminopeptidase